jgi:hypothetical protein
VVTSECESESTSSENSDSEMASIWADNKILPINDIPSVENKSNVANLVFADDTNIGIRSGRIHIAVTKLNAVTSLLESWFQKGRKRTNTKKCTITLFSKRLRHYCRSRHPVNIFNDIIAWTNEIKYLGVTLDSKLTYRTHTSAFCEKLITD